MKTYPNTRNMINMLCYMITMPTMLLPQLVAVPLRHKNDLMSGWVRDRGE